MAKHGTGGQVRVRFYMEGRYIPNGLTSVTVAGNTGQPATAQLQLTPTNTIKHILPGTWIHVFTTDPWDLEPQGDLSDFKLLFEGVVVARGVTKQDDARSFTVQCADPSVYWVEARQYWMNLMGSNGNIVDEVVTATTSGHGRFGKTTSDGATGFLLSELGKVLKDDEEHFLDSLLSSIDGIGNVNPFYTNIRNRFRLTDRILRGRAGKTEKLFTLALLSDFLEGLAGRMSGQSNLAEVVNTLLSSIMHEWVSVVAPPFVSARIFERDVFGNIKRKEHKETVKDRRGRRKVELYKYRMAYDDIIGSMIFKPHVYTLSPPTCNVLFPNMFDQLSYNENFMAEPTRVQMQPQLAFARGAKLVGLQYLRPTEMEIYTAITRDPDRKTSKKRTADAKYADGLGQAPTFHEFDWTMNEERIRGIVPSFINLAPAPSTLSLSDQGKKQPRGTRTGGMPKYLQNVASYEYYKSKFAARQASIAGPYNMRPVPGFPILALDDSDANMSMVAYLNSVVHSIDANGNAITQYSISYPRLVDEVDMNRPKVLAKASRDRSYLDLFRGEDGQYEFEDLFDGLNRPAIPEWFDETFKELDQLDWKYNEWFGGNAGVVESVLFQEVSGTDEEQEEAKAANNSVDLASAVRELNSIYRFAREWGREFIEASKFTDRGFTKIDEAFRFVGASPLDAADKKVKDQSDSTATNRFTKQPSEFRLTDYKNWRLETFVGDPSAGSGYNGSPIKKPAAVIAELSDEQEFLNAEEDAKDRMSGAFPVFDTVIHTGDQATDKSERNKLLKDSDQRAKSAYARYDGRPKMYDFEYRLWKESVDKATDSFLSTEAQGTFNALRKGRYKVGENGLVEKLTPEEQAAAEVENTARRAIEFDARREQRNATNMTPEEQAPTGDDAENETVLPLPQPLSEKQVVDLRRAIVDAYREELERTRGFTG